MSRTFAIEVINQKIVGSATVYSPASLYEQLGRADEIGLQVILDDASGGGNMTVEYQDSNEGADSSFSSGSSGSNAAPLTDTIVLSGAKITWVHSPTRTPGAFGRVMLSVPASNSATVRVYVCGRSRGG